MLTLYHKSHEEKKETTPQTNLDDFYFLTNFKENLLFFKRDTNLLFFFFPFLYIYVIDSRRISF